MCVGVGIGIGAGIGGINQDLAVSVIIWWHLGASESIWQDLAALGNICQSGSIWAGSIWQHPGSVAASGIILQQLEASGGTWQNLGRCVPDLHVHVNQLETPTGNVRACGDVSKPLVKTALLAGTFV